MICSNYQNLGSWFLASIIQAGDLVAFQAMELENCFAVLTFKFLLLGIASSHLVWLESSFLPSHMDSEVIIELTTYILNCFTLNYRT